MSDDSHERGRSHHTALGCLADIARRKGIDCIVGQLIHDTALDAEPSAERLADIARRIGLIARELQTGWTRLVRMGPVCPLLARLCDDHWVIIEGFRRGGDGTEYVELVDGRNLPARTRYVVDRAQFEARWEGEIVLIKRRFTLGDPDQPFGLRWFIPEILRQRDAVVDVVVAALFLHGIALAVPIFFQIIIDKVLVHESFSTLYVLAAGVGTAVLFDAVLSFLRSYLLLHATTRIDIRVATRTFRHLLGLSTEFFERFPAGVLTKHMQQTSVVREFLTGRLLMTLLDASVLVVFIPVLAFYSGMLTLVVLGFSIAMAAVIALLIFPYRSRLNRLYKAEGDRQALLVETIHGMATVKALALEPRQSRDWDSYAADAINKYYEVGQISTIARTVSALLEKLMTIAVVVLGALAVFDHRMSVGELVAFQMLAGRVSNPLVQLVGLIHQYQEVALSVRMLGTVMNEPVERNIARGLQPDLSGAIEIEKVSFTYPNARTPSLEEVTFRIEPGAYVGVVGRSGSGKTTLSRLIQGLYSGYSGLIRLDGNELRDIDLTHLRRSIGVVPQEAFLFRGRIRDNIGITKPDATIEEIVAAAQVAGADEFVQRLPERYETMLEEGATNLSGGQRQRLSIARAILRNPPILILDEATSALDPDSEAVVVDNLGQIAGGRTTIVISHRLATISNADGIIVMDQGKIVDIGHHKELIGRCSIYAHLWKQQARGLI
ncbi:MAG: ATP-binding cassette domain-containing protein [Azospirillum sp.]|nr:ATP-binding cassette domain-containing protein [Azospirillum sp.]